MINKKHKEELLAILEAINANKNTIAQRSLKSLITQYPDECDLYRLKALTYENATADNELVAHIYTTKDTWGDIIELLDAGDPSSLRFKYDTKIGDVTFTISTPTRLEAALAITATQLHWWDVAYSLTENDPHPYKLFAKGWLYHTTGRYSDALDVFRQTTQTVRLDYDDTTLNPTQYDYNLITTAFTLQAACYAHLGRVDEALTATKVVIEDENSTILQAANAHYYRGLTYRIRGDEDNATQHLALASSMNSSYDAEAALQDTSIKLRQTTPELIEQRTDYWDETTQPTIESLNSAKSANDRAELLEEAQNELSMIIGMEDVKEQLEQIVSTIKVDKIREERGQKVSARTYNMLLSGPPGTGKTTIAKILSKYYNGLGVTNSQKFKVVSRADLVGQYVGQSEAKTKEILDNSLGGVLVIDEFYTLFQGKDGKDDQFGQAVVSSLLTYMEDHRDELIVMATGYEEDLKKALRTNEGLESRFNRWIRFSSYSADELVKILQMVAKGKGVTVPEDTEEVFYNYFENITEARGDDGVPLIDKLGNGRFARNILEAALGEMEFRLASGGQLEGVSDEDLSRLRPDDARRAVENHRKNI